MIICGCINCLNRNIWFGVGHATANVHTQNSNQRVLWFRGYGIGKFEQQTGSAMKELSDIEDEMHKVFFIRREQ